MYKCIKLQYAIHITDAASSNGSGPSVASIGGAVGGVVVLLIIAVLCVVIFCIIRSKRNKEKKGSFIIESNVAVYYNKTYDNVDKCNITDTNLHTVNAAPSLSINNPVPALESSFIQSSTEGNNQS